MGAAASCLVHLPEGRARCKIVARRYLSVVCSALCLIGPFFFPLWPINKHSSLSPASFVIAFLVFAAKEARKDMAVRGHPIGHRGTDHRLRRVYEHDPGRSRRGRYQDGQEGRRRADITKGGCHHAAAGGVDTVDVRKSILGSDSRGCFIHMCMEWLLLGGGALRFDCESGRQMMSVGRFLFGVSLTLHLHLPGWFASSS